MRFWLGTLFSGQSGLTLSRPLKIRYKRSAPAGETTAPPARGVPQRLLRPSPGALRRSAWRHRRREAEGLGYSGLAGQRRRRRRHPRGAHGAWPPSALLAPAYAEMFASTEAQFQGRGSRRIALEEPPRNGRASTLAPRFRKEVSKGDGSPAHHRGRRPRASSIARRQRRLGRGPSSRAGRGRAIATPRTRCT